jgi:hypothetical protein
MFSALVNLYSLDTNLPFTPAGLFACLLSNSKKTTWDFLYEALKALSFCRFRLYSSVTEPAMFLLYKNEIN